MSVILKNGRAGDLTASAAAVTDGYSVRLTFDSADGAHEELIDDRVFDTLEEAETNRPAVARRWYPCWGAGTLQVRQP